MNDYLVSLALPLRYRLLRLGALKASQYEELAVPLALKASVLTLIPLFLIRRNSLDTLTSGQWELLLAAYGLLSLVFSLLPVFQPFPRWSDQIPAHWPLSAFDLGLGNLTASVSGGWAAGYWVLVGTWGYLSLLQGGASWYTLCASAAMVFLGLLALVSLCHGIQLIIEALPNKGLRILATLGCLLALGRFTQAATAQYSVRDPRMLSGMNPSTWMATLVFAATVSVAGYLWAMSRLYRRTADVTINSSQAPSLSIERLLLYCLTRRSPFAAVFAQHLAYISRNPRYWFLVAYGPVMALLTLSKGFKDHSAEVRVFLLTLACVSASTVFLFNLFGLEGNSAPRWFSLPLMRATVLRAKAAAAVTAAAPGCVFGVLLNIFYLHSSPQTVIAGLLLFLSLVFCASSAGMFTSVRFPFPVPMETLFHKFLPMETTSVVMGTVIASAGLSAAGWRLAERASISVAWPQAAILLGATGLFLWASRLAARPAFYEPEEFLERMKQND